MPVTRPGGGAGAPRQPESEVRPGRPGQNDVVSSQPNPLVLFPRRVSSSYDSADDFMDPPAAATSHAPAASASRPLTVSTATTTTATTTTTKPASVALGTKPVAAGAWVTRRRARAVTMPNIQVGTRRKRRDPESPGSDSPPASVSTSASAPLQHLLAQAEFSNEPKRWIKRLRTSAPDAAMAAGAPATPEDTLEESPPALGVLLQQCSVPAPLVDPQASLLSDPGASGRPRSPLLESAASSEALMMPSIVVPETVTQSIGDHSSACGDVAHGFDDDDDDVLDQVRIASSVDPADENAGYVEDKQSIAKANPAAAAAADDDADDPELVIPSSFPEESHVPATSGIDVIPDSRSVDPSLSFLLSAPVPAAACVGGSVEDVDDAVLLRRSPSPSPRSSYDQRVAQLGRTQSAHSGISRRRSTVSSDGIITDSVMALLHGDTTD